MGPKDRRFDPALVPSTDNFAGCVYCGGRIRPGEPKAYNQWGAGCPNCTSRLLPLDDPAELTRLSKLRVEAEARAAVPGCTGSCGEKRARRKSNCLFCRKPADCEAWSHLTHIGECDG